MAAALTPTSAPMNREFLSPKAMARILGSAALLSIFRTPWPTHSRRRAIRLTVLPMSAASKGGEQGLSRAVSCIGCHRSRASRTLATSGRHWQSGDPLEDWGGCANFDFRPRGPRLGPECQDGNFRVLARGDRPRGSTSGPGVIFTYTTHRAV